MRRNLKQLITEYQIIKTGLIFFAVYILLSISWMQVKYFYGYGITFVASKFVAGVKDSRLEGLTKENNIINVSFSSTRRGKYFYNDIRVKTSSYSFNVPLTLSLLVSLSPYIKRKLRAYVEALLILLLFHILHVFFEGTMQLTNMLMRRGIEDVSVIRLSFYQFLRGITEYASISFAPFLIMIYIFVKFRKQGLQASSAS